jgi:hypothetical protein
MSENKVGDSVSTLDKKKLNRRDFIKRSAAIGARGPNGRTPIVGLRKPIGSCARNKPKCYLIIPKCYLIIPNIYLLY